VQAATMIAAANNAARPAMVAIAVADRRTGASWSRRDECDSSGHQPSRGQIRARYGPDRTAIGDPERSTADKAQTGVDLPTHGHSVHDKPVSKLMAQGRGRKFKSCHPDAAERGECGRRPLATSQ
jgi:hypothetical protein